MKRPRAGGIYQDAAEGRGAASGTMEDSRPTRCRGAAANALLISATEKIPLASLRPLPSTAVRQPARTLTQDRSLGSTFGPGLDLFFWGNPESILRATARSPSFITKHCFQGDVLK